MIPHNNTRKDIDQRRSLFHGRRSPDHLFSMRAPIPTKGIQVPEDMSFTSGSTHSCEGSSKKHHISSFMVRMSTPTNVTCEWTRISIITRPTKLSKLVREHVQSSRQSRVCGNHLVTFECRRTTNAGRLPHRACHGYKIQFFALCVDVSRMSPDINTCK